jgi:hypothetical protein
MNKGTTIFSQIFSFFDSVSGCIGRLIAVTLAEIFPLFSQEISGEIPSSTTSRETCLTKEEIEEK